MLRQKILVIDPQVDFCSPQGNLYVTGADKDMERLAAFIKKSMINLHDIHVTMDCHHFFSIFHPIFWVDEHGKHPNVFTVIPEPDVRSGRWMAAIRSLQKKAHDYTVQLATNGRYVLCMWPPHCLIGQPGNSLFPPMAEALLGWEQSLTGNMVDFVTKGSNFMTEHYSAVKADVPDANDEGTLLNVPLLKTLANCDRILLAGEALSHCLANTVNDIADNFGEENIKKFVLLTDCCSNVGGFEALGEQFVKGMSARGMQVARSTDL